MPSPTVSYSSTPITHPRQPNVTPIPDPPNASSFYIGRTVTQPGARILNILCDPPHSPYPVVKNLLLSQPFACNSTENVMLSNLNVLRDHPGHASRSTKAPPAAHYHHHHPPAHTPYNPPTTHKPPLSTPIPAKQYLTQPPTHPNHHHICTPSRRSPICFPPHRPPLARKSRTLSPRSSLRTLCCRA